MSADPQMVQQMLMQSLGTPPANARTSPMAAGSQLAQKVLLMQALQHRQPNAPSAAGTQAANSIGSQMANDPTMQAMQQAPQTALTPDQLQQLQQPIQFADPTMATPGYS